MTTLLTPGSDDDEEGRRRRLVVYVEGAMGSALGESIDDWAKGLRLKGFRRTVGELQSAQAASSHPHQQPDGGWFWLPAVNLAEGPGDAGVLIGQVDNQTNLQLHLTAKRKWRARGLHRRERAAARLVDRCSGFVRQELPALKSGPSPQSLTGAALLIAGHAHCEARDEWKCHLAGEDGNGLARNLAARAAWGFVWSAVRYRLRDATGLLWRPLDAVLRSRGLSRLVVWVPTLGIAVAVIRHDGFYGLVTYDTNLGFMVTGSYGVIKLGRWWRKVTPKPRPERVGE
jgi:hypothetical protein